MKDLSVVIPCYNEGENLLRLFDAVEKAVPADIRVEVVFVNNGSTDGTARLFETHLPRLTFARVVNVAVNQGYGYGILAGLRAAEGTTIGWTHADLQTDPADAIDAFRAFRTELEAGRTIVKGRRRGRPLIDRLFTAAMGRYASAALGGRFSDINAQPKLFPRALLGAMDAAPHDFSLDLYLLWLASKEGYAIAEHPVEFGRRTGGEAKGGGSLRLKWKLTRRTLRFISDLRRAIGQGRM